MKKFLFILLLALLAVHVPTEAAPGISIERTLVTTPVAGVAYTPHCLTECHMVINFTISSTGGLQLPVPIDISKVSNRYIKENSGDDLTLKAVRFLVNETFIISVPDYERQNVTVYQPNNGTVPEFATGQNSTHYWYVAQQDVLIGSHNETKWRHVWQDLGSRNLVTNTTYVVDLVYTRTPKLGEYATDVIPTILGVEMPEFAFFYSTWDKRKNITITNTGSELTNFQHLENVTYDSDMQADFDDLRATWYNTTSGAEEEICLTVGSNSAELSQSNSNWAQVLFKVPKIRASSSETIYLYYGNSGASGTSNNTCVYNYYSHFTSAPTNTGQGAFQISDTTYLDSNGIGSGSAWHGPRNTTSLETTVTDFIMKARVWQTHTSAGLDSHRVTLDDSSDVKRILFSTRDGDGGSANGATLVKESTSNTDFNGEDSAWATSRYSSGEVSTWNNDNSTFELRRLGTTGQLFDDGTQLGANFTLGTTTISKISFGILGYSTFAQGTTHRYDWILVRKTSTAIPTSSVGAEESNAVDSTVALNSPADGSTQTALAVTFNYTPVFNATIVNASLWTNVSGSWASTANNASAVTNNSANTISYTFSADGVYIWNIRVCSSTFCVFNSSNYTLTMNAYPDVSLVSPAASIKRQLWTISNSGNSNAFTNFQFPVNITFDSDICTTFCDLRFKWRNVTHNFYQTIDYFIENVSSSTDANITLEIPRIRASTTESVYAIYGNSSLTTNESSWSNTISSYQETSLTSSAQFGSRIDGRVASMNGYIYMTGGTVSGTYKGDVWRSSDGVTWTELNSSAFPIRAGHAMVSHSNKIYVLGGRNSTDYLNDVWSSSDGITWTQENASAGWTARRYFQAASFGGKIYLYGGDGSGSKFNDVWSSSTGASWTQDNSSALTQAREGTAMAVFNGKIWLSGGRHSSNEDDVWHSSNGVTWTQANASAFSARYRHAMFVYDNKLWVTGGSEESTDLSYSDDGTTWTTFNSSATSSSGGSAVVSGRTVYLIPAGSSVYKILRSHTSPYPSITYGSEQEHPTEVGSLTVNFTYTPVSANTFKNASLWTNASGSMASTANNASALVNNTENGISYTFSARGVYRWYVQVCTTDNLCMDATERKIETNFADVIPVISTVELNMSSIGGTEAITFNATYSDADSNINTWSFGGSGTATTFTATNLILNLAGISFPIDKVLAIIDSLLAQDTHSVDFDRTLSGYYQNESGTQNLSLQTFAYNVTFNQSNTTDLLNISWSIASPSGCSSLANQSATSGSITNLNGTQNNKTTWTGDCLTETIGSYVQDNTSTTAVNGTAYATHSLNVSNGAAITWSSISTGLSARSGWSCTTLSSVNIPSSSFNYTAQANNCTKSDAIFGARTLSLVNDSVVANATSVFEHNITINNTDTVINWSNVQLNFTQFYNTTHYANLSDYLITNVSVNQSLNYQAINTSSNTFSERTSSEFGSCSAGYTQLSYACRVCEGFEDRDECSYIYYYRNTNDETKSFNITINLPTSRMTDFTSGTVDSVLVNSSATGLTYGTVGSNFQINVSTSRT